jgi:hypothetical protein
MTNGNASYGIAAARAGAAVLGLVVAWAGFCRGADAEQPAASLPQGHSGIAAKYPGDAGIEKDPRVVFVEDFEQDGLETLWGRWETVGGRETMSLAADAPAGSRGKQSLVMDRREGSGGSLYRRIRNESGGWGYDRLFLRFYVKFDPDCGEIHHGVSALGGNHPATRWPMVSAGNRPDGAKTFWSGIEPHGNRWVWDYYTYWCEMRGSPPAGRTWGNSFIRDPGLTVEKGRWICVEHMIKINDVGRSNGEQALWLDGKLVSHLGEGFPKGLWVWDKFQPGQGGQGVRWGAAGRENFQVPEGGAPFEGFRWRTVEELNVNYVWIYTYTAQPPGHRIKVWFDDLVAATSYIGPLQKP